MTCERGYLPTIRPHRQNTPIIPRLHIFPEIPLPIRPFFETGDSGELVHSESGLVWYGELTPSGNLMKSSYVGEWGEDRPDMVIVDEYLDCAVYMIDYTSEARHTN